MKTSNTTLGSATPTITAGAYSAGDVVGGVMEFARLLGDHRRGVLKTVTVIDLGDQKAALTLLLFNAEPAGVAADNAAFALSAADAAKLVGKVNVAADDYETVGGEAVAVLDVADVVEGYAGANARDAVSVGTVWGVLVTTGTPTYASTSDLTVRLGCLADG